MRHVEAKRSVLDLISLKPRQGKQAMSQKSITSSGSDQVWFVADWSTAASQLNMRNSFFFPQIVLYKLHLTVVQWR